MAGRYGTVRYGTDHRLDGRGARRGRSRKIDRFRLPAFMCLSDFTEGTPDLRAGWRGRYKGEGRGGVDY